MYIAIFCLLFVVWLLFSTCLYLHGQMHPHTGSSMNDLHGVSAILIAASSFLAAVPLALMLGNLALWIIPPLRRAHNEAFADAPNASFNDGMRQLATFAALVLPLCLVAAAVGIIDPWHN